MRFSGGMPMGDYSHCAHCGLPPTLQLYGFYLCASCRECAEISHYWNHGVEEITIVVHGERYHADSCYSLNPDYSINPGFFDAPSR